MSPKAVDKVELDNLQGQYEACMDKLDALYEALRLETDPARKVDLKELIEIEKRHLEYVGEKMTILKLGDALLRLDYAGQVWDFRSNLHAQGAAAFLVRPPGNGGEEAKDSIRLLVKRLLEGIPYKISTPPIKVRLESNVRKSGAAALWRELAKKVGPSVCAKEEEVAERVAERLSTQNVVLILTGLNWVDLGVCMRDFWAPLAQTVQQAWSGSYRLILLLVDYAGEASLPGPQAPPVQLPHVVRFPETELATWIKVVLDDLPVDALPKANDLDGGVTLLVQQLVSGGPDRGPDPVLWQISEIWQCPWEVVDTWLEV